MAVVTLGKDSTDRVPHPQPSVPSVSGLLCVPSGGCCVWVLKVMLVPITWLGCYLLSFAKLKLLCLSLLSTVSSWDLATHSHVV